MFVEVSGFRDTDIDVPDHLVDADRPKGSDSCSGPEESDSCSDSSPDRVPLALVRWLSPHPRAVLRDSELRPVCPPPFDVNHALWRFSKTDRRRIPFQGRNISRQIDMFDGDNVREQREHADRLKCAWYGLVRIGAIDKYMNCTCIDNDSELILQTITLPF